MAGGAAHPGAELLAFERFLDSSLQPLVYGYGRGSLRELRAREFGRLAGETGGGNLCGAGGGHTVSRTNVGAGELLLPVGAALPHWRRILNRKTWRNVSTCPPRGRGSLGSYLQPQGLLLLRLPVLWYRHGPLPPVSALREQD